MIGLGFGNFQSVTQEPFSFGNALQFDGVNDYVSFDGINLSEGCISMWYKTPIAGGVFLLSGDDSDTNNEFEIWARANRAYIAVERQGVLNTTLNTPSQSLNTWHHVFLKLTTNQVSLWFDGQASSQNPINLAGDFSIKRMAARSSLASTSNVVLDEVAIWNTAFDLPNNLYSTGNGDYATNYSPENLIAYWRMNGSGTDTTAVDEQGNYDGTLNNFPASGMWVAH